MRLLNRFESLSCLVSIVFSSRECLSSHISKLPDICLLKALQKLSFKIWFKSSYQLAKMKKQSYINNRKL